MQTAFTKYLSGGRNIGFGHSLEFQAKADIIQTKLQRQTTFQTWKMNGKLLPQGKSPRRVRIENYTFRNQSSKGIV